MFAVALFAAAVASGTPHLSAHRTSNSPTLDGHLDEEAWEEAPESSTFIQKFPNEGHAPTERTAVRVLYDDDAIYVGIDCPQERAPISPRLTRRDRPVESDWVSVNLDTRGDRKSAFEFLVNASGVMVDGVRVNDVEYSSDWDETWDARTWIGDRKWSAEIRIPLRILRFGRAPVQSWGMQVRRYISARQEIDEWAYIPRSVAAEVSKYGRLDDLRGLEPQSPIELRPFGLARLRSRDATTDTTGRGADFKLSAGLDVKWHPSQDLTLDATVNPDFAQIEADQVVLNLSTYEVYKPEKRPFFLEGADLVAPRLGLPLVYTKRIGRAPANPALRTGAPFSERLVDVPEPSPIYGATKLTGRLSERVSIGTLSALVGPNDAQVDLGSGPRTTRRVEPMTAFNVLRLKRDLGDNAHVGLLMTSTTRSESTSEYVASPDNSGRVLCPSGAPADVAAGKRCFHDAYVLGLDGRFRQGEWVTSGQLVASASQHGPLRTLPDGTVIASGDSGGTGDFGIAKEGGEHFVGYSFFGTATRKLDFNDLGFMWRQNVRYAGGGVEYRTLEPWWETLETHTRVDAFAADNLSGLAIARDVTFGATWKLRGFWQVGGDVTYRARRFDDREVGDGTALERGRATAARARATTDPRARIAASVGAQYTAVEAGYVMSGDANVTWRVLPQFDVELAPQASSTSGEPRYAVDGVSGTHLFAPLTAQNVSATLRATYTFLPRLSLQAYAQAFLASGHYEGFVVSRAGTGNVVRLSDLVNVSEAASKNPDFTQGAMNINVQLRWEYRLGSVFSLVYARTQSPNVVLGPTEIGSLDPRSIRRAPGLDFFYLKVSYFWG